MREQIAKMRELYAALPDEPEWLTMEDIDRYAPVSYTHLDVYKRQGLLCTRDSMTRFCYQNPEAEFEGNYCAEYGFKVQTPQHTYL